MKKIRYTLLLCLVVISIPFQVFAHNVTETGSEALGWIIGTHTPSKESKFWWTPGTEQKWKDRLNGGNSYMYSETSNNLRVVNSTALQTDNYIETKGQSWSTWVARVVTVGTTGQHKDSWYMQFNSSYDSDYTDSQWKRIAQHELGHVFGLKDLYDSSNSSLLMYGYAGSYSGLKTKDLTGLKKIWGNF